MKKAILVLSAICFGRALLHAQQNPTLPVPPHSGEPSHDIPSMNDQVGDARGSASARASAENNPVKPDLRSQARARSATAQANGPADVADPTRHHEPAIVPAASPDTTTLAHTLANARFNARAEVLDALSERVAANDREVNQVKANSVGLTGSARDAFKSALSDWHAQQAALQRAIENARNADPDTWPQVRSHLATQFEAYSVALTRAESSSAINPP